MNKKGVGLIEGITKLGLVFILLLLIMYGGGAILGIAGNKGLLMIGIFLLVLWMLIKKK